MARSKTALMLSVVGMVLFGAVVSALGGAGDSLVTLVDRDYALSIPLLGDCPAYEVSNDMVMIMVPGSMAGLMPALEAAGPVPAAESPMWVTPAELPEETARKAGLEVLLRDGMNTVFTGSEDAAYGLLAQGYFIVRVELLPLRQIRPAVWGRRMVGEMLEYRPLDTSRRRFLRAVTDSVDTLRLKDVLHFLEYDDANDRFRSRFQARPEVRQEVVPYLIDMLTSFVGPYGGDVAEQQFVQKLGGDFACTDTIPCDTVFVNVIATKPGKRTSAHYILCAHYDAIASRTPGWSDRWYVEDVPAPGGDDNGTGIAVLLECARLLGPLDLDVGVKFIAFSGEEPGLLGSEYYVDHLAPEDSVIAVINVDMVGYVDETPLLEIIYDWKSRWVSDQLEDLHGILGLDFEVEPFNLSGVGNSDHANFWRAGIPGSMLIEELADHGDLKGSPVNPYYHTVGDTVGLLDMGMVAGTARMVAGVMARFAEMPDDSTSDLVLTEGSLEWNWDGRSTRKPPVAGDSLEVKVRALNLGKAMEQPEPYTFEIRRGSLETGRLLYRSTEVLQVLRGEHTNLEVSWLTDPETYGDVTFSFSLLPAAEDVESDITDNSIEVELEIMPTTVMLRDLHVTPHPVSFSGGEPRFRFEILHPEGDFNAVMDVWIFDILGTVVGRGSLEKTPLVHDFDAGENAVALSRLVPREIAPGLYICRARLRLLGEPGIFDETFKFAVDR